MKSRILLLLTALVMVIGVSAGTSITAAAPKLAPSTAIRYPAGFTTPIYVGETKVWPTTPATSPTTTTTTTVRSTTTTVTPSTTGAPSSTSTSTTAAPTTTAASTTTSTAPPTSPGTSGCGLQAAAFCETFSQAYPDSVSRTGDLDETLWGVSRMHNQGSAGIDQWFTPKGYVGRTKGSPTLAEAVPGCNIGFAPNDVKVCNGRMIEAVQDGGNDSKTMLATYPKQPFNFAGRTGTVVFDVSSDSAGPHTAWPEFWLTDQPIPAPGIDDHGEPRNGFGLAFSGRDGCGGIPNTLKTYSNWQETTNDNAGDFECPIPGKVNGQLNHVRITVAANRIEVFMTNPGSTNEFKVASYATNLTFTQGLVWLSDGHYNACKDDAGQCDHSFAWDNLGFDGPKTYRDLSFDALDNHEPGQVTGFENGDGNPGFNLGWQTSPGSPKTVTVNGVHLGNKTPVSCAVLFNSYAFFNQEVAKVSLNGGTPITTPWVYGEASYTPHSIAAAVPCASVHTDGSPNVLTFTSSQDRVTVANINIVLVDAQTVP